MVAAVRHELLVQSRPRAHQGRQRRDVRARRPLTDDESVCLATTRVGALAFSHCWFADLAYACDGCSVGASWRFIRLAFHLVFDPRVRRMAVDCNGAT